MIEGLGNDIIEVERIEKAIIRRPFFVEKIFTPNERAYCEKYRESGRHYAGRFAAKEAILKALGTGLAEGISWLDIEVVNDTLGKPIALLSERLKAVTGSCKIEVSISHCRSYASAVAIRHSSSVAKEE